LRYTQIKSGFIYSVLLLNLVVVCGFSGLTRADDVSNMLKEIRQELRQIQNDMFAGKKNQAIAALEPLQAKLAAIKAADPNNPSLKTLENKYDQLVRDLKRRTGKDLGDGWPAMAKKDRQDILSVETAEAEALQADVEALMTAYRQVKPLFEQVAGNVFYYTELAPVRELLGQIDAFEQNDLPDLNANLTDFADKYGSTPDAIDAKAEFIGYANPFYRASYAYTIIREGIANVEKTRTAVADDLIRRAKKMKARAARGVRDFNRFEEHKKLTRWAVLAAELDYANPRVTAFNEELDEWIAADMRALNAKIDMAVFPIQASDAPPDALMLAKAAWDFLQQEEDKRAVQGKSAGTILNLVVTGPWQIFKKNILSEPIQYSLPMAAAMQIESEKALGLVRVYIGAMLTEEMKGVAKAPPFIGANVSDSYFVRLDAVK
jgi:hypothetical protein